MSSAPGSQGFNTLYGFLILPLGRTEISNQEQWLREILAQELAANGITALPPGPLQADLPLLKINIRRLGAGAYDLLFTRRIIVELQAVMEFIELDGTSYSESISVREREFSSFGFATQLAPIVNKIFRRASKQLSANLASFNGVCSRQRIDETVKN